MLILSNVSKNYSYDGISVHALKNINLSLPDTGLVCILGPSGSGKSTFLNILGAMLSPDSGSLYFNNQNILEFTEAQKDLYRGRDLGFVFQSGNLSPHLSSLDNILLALRFSSIPKSEHKALALNALNRVNLSDCTHKKTATLSGGQYQRVAVARAIASNPKILLADEPTGALDDTNANSVMQLLASLAQDRLVVVVTHNAQLASLYANRIISIHNGEIVDDIHNTPSYSVISPDSLPPQRTQTTFTHSHADKSASHPFFNALSLAHYNLTSKKVHSIVMSLASGIGVLLLSIIISVIGAFSAFTYNIENDLLYSMPIVVGENSYDAIDLLAQVNTDSMPDGYEDRVLIYKLLSDLYAEAVSNVEISQDYLDYINNLDSSLYSSLVFDYGVAVENNLFTDATISGVTFTSSINYIKSLIGQYSSTAYAVFSSLNLFNPYTLTTPVFNKNYECVYGSLPQETNEIMLVLDKNGTLPDYVVALLGYYNSDQIVDYLNGDESVKDEWSYDELASKQFTFFFNDVIYEQAADDGLFNYSNNFSQSIRPLSVNNPNEGISLKITAIARPLDNGDAVLSPGLYYTPQLIQAYISNAKSSTIVNYLQDKINKNTDPFTGSKVTDANFSTIVRSVGGDNIASSVLIYAASVEDKHKILEYLDAWNTSNSDGSVKYVDNVSSVLGYVGDIVSVAAIVAVIMAVLAVLIATVLLTFNTLQSINSRKTELKLLRCMGASRNVIKGMVMSELSIIGFLAGLIGVAITYLALAVASIFISVISPLVFSPISAIIVVLANTAVLTIAGFFPANYIGKLI